VKSVMILCSIRKDTVLRFEMPAEIGLIKLTERSRRASQIMRNFTFCVCTSVSVLCWLNQEKELSGPVIRSQIWFENAKI
jgi:hypothetical protein